MTVVINGTTGVTSVNGSAAAPSVTGTDTDTGIVYGTNTLSLATGGTTALTANSAQGIQVLNTLGVGNTTPSTSGAGITFPATQSASTDANTLDDYEEGTWTPTLNRGTTNPTVSYTIQQGKYTKIGRQVTVHCTIQISSPSSNGSGINVIAGLPFVANTDGAAYGMNGVVHYNNILTTVVKSVMYYSGGFVFNPALTANTAEVNENYVAGYLGFTATYTAST